MDPSVFISRLDQIESVTVCEVKDNKIWYSTEELRNSDHNELDMDRLREILKDLKYDRTTYVSKGGYPAIVRTKDGKSFQVHLAVGFSFFWVKGVKGSFYFEGEAADTWDEIYLDSLTQARRSNRDR